jgi:zinc transporter ZupT
MRVLTAFSIGIVLGTALLHLLPESIELFNEGIGAEHSEHACTITNTTSDDHNITASGSSHDDHDHSAEEDEEHSHGFPYACLISLGTALVMFFTEHEISAAVARSKESKRIAKEKQAAELTMPATTVVSIHCGDHCEEDHAQIDVSNAAVGKPNDATKAEEEEQTAMSGYLVDFGLSIHSLLLGLTLGLLTDYGTIRALVIATACDQLADGVAVGSTLSHAHLKMWQKIVLRLVFGASCAAGVAIGLIVDEAGGEPSKVTQGVFAAMSSGMLLLMAFTNMLPVLTKPFQELAACCGGHGGSDTGSNGGDQEAMMLVAQPLSTAWRLFLYLCVILGSTAMALIAVWGH